METSVNAGLLVVCVFWGETFRRLFAELCAPSLLADGNLPALPTGNHKLLLFTTREDWDALERDGALQPLSRYLSPEFREIRPEAYADKYACMSAGHVSAASTAHAEKRTVIFICPDAILSRGAIVAITNRIWRDGFAVVLAPAIRFSATALIPEFTRLKRASGSDVLDLAPRRIMELALPHLHPESERFTWRSAYFSYFPVCCLWPLPGGGALLMRAMSWAPMAINYGKLATHDGQALADWTLDGDYVFRNFGNDRDAIYVVTDSDECVYLSLSPDEDRTDPMVRNWTRGAALRYAYHHRVMDPLKRDLFLEPVVLHAGEVGAAGARMEKDVQRLLAKVLARPPSWMERHWCHYFRGGLRGVLEHARDWLKVRIHGR